MTRVLTLTSVHCRLQLSLSAHRAAPLTQLTHRFSSTSANSQQKSQASTLAEFEENEEEKRIDALRDISGLTEPQKRRLCDQVPEVDNDYKRSVRFQRKLYGKFGSESGVDPRLSWPPKQKAMELAELYREWEPPLEERMATLQASIQENADKDIRREKKVRENMAKMGQWIAEYRKREKQKEVEVEKKEEKKRKVLQEAREYFGYYVDPRDPRFQDMLEEKDKQDKALAKKQKKEKRMEKMVARLQHMAQSASVEEKQPADSDKATTEKTQSKDKVAS